MKRLMLLLAGTTAVGGALAAEAAPQGAGDAVRGQPIASTVCAACHGPDGNSIGAPNPKLAGQHPEYLFRQMRNFKSGERVNPIMNGMIAPYTEDQMRDFAAYFASQKQVGDASKSKETLELGQKIYRAGIAAKCLPACAGCHGPSGAGIPAQFPRIGGQLSDYLETQLKSFRDGTRANDPNKMMRTIALKMTDAEIKAIADYTAGLR